MDTTYLLASLPDWLASMQEEIDALERRLIDTERRIGDTERRIGDLESFVTFAAHVLDTEIEQRMAGEELASAKTEGENMLLSHAVKRLIERAETLETAIADATRLGNEINSRSLLTFA